MWNAFISLWRNIFDYRGRTTVKEYWLAVLMTYISLMIGAFLLGKLVKVLDIGRFIEPLAVLGVYSIIILIPLVAMFVRRMRDTGLSKAIIICVNICMPFFGGIYLACLNSDNTTESRRERFLKLIQPFADIDIRELEDFDCASLCILNKSLLIWFFYDDIKEYTDSKDLKCYSSVGKCYLHELCKSTWVEPEAVPEENIEMWYHHLKSVFEKLDKKTKKACGIHLCVNILVYVWHICLQLNKWNYHGPGRRNNNKIFCFPYIFVGAGGIWINSVFNVYKSTLGSKNKGRQNIGGDLYEKNYCTYVGGYDGYIHWRYCGSRGDKAP